MSSLLLIVLFRGRPLRLDFAGGNKGKDGAQFTNELGTLVGCCSTDGGDSTVLAPDIAVRTASLV